MGNLDVLSRWNEVAEKVFAGDRAEGTVKALVKAKDECILC